DTQNGLALKDNGYVYKTTNRGIEWNVCYYNSVGYTSILYSSVNSALVIGYNGKIARTTNYGNTWNEVSSPVSTNLYKGCFVNVSTGFIVGNTKTVLKSTDTGISWNKLDSLPIGFITNPKNIEFINENTGFIIGDKIQNGYYTQIIKTTNCGLNWNLIYDNFNTTSSSHFDKIKFFNEMTGWIYYDNNIKKTTNGGLNWFIYNSPSSSFYIFTLKMINENTGWAGGTVSNRGKLYKTTNAGVSWFEQFNQANYYLKQIPYSIYSLDSNDVWFCGADDIMFHTTTGGVVTSVSPISNLIPEKYLLQQNYPNPFNPSTKINYEIKLAGFVSLKVFDLLGKEVAMLVNEKQSAGSYAVDFNSTEFNLPSGIYFYTLSTGEFKETRKMVLIK
ncbi:MAG: T9SS type A sorting domain-containing protein, partial [Ignavibacteria bacterium]|nr:T9SS type A sorting domain-containing protein [Ignavibacteria bacterium]